VSPAIKRFIWSRLPSWSWIPLAVFLVLQFQGALLGLTDDEAYYWVLAQKPALGYAYHPPAVAWFIAAAEALFGGVFDHSAALVRLPATLSAALTVALALFWMGRAGAPARRISHGGAVLLSFVGFFSLAWMMVPDLPLFLGWMAAFVATWEICFGASRSRLFPSLLFAGIVLTLLSKYSGLLAAGSAGLAILLWAPRDRRMSGVLAVIAGVIVAAVPAIIWNAQHEWASILYQVRDRHGGAEVSLKRFARFWAAEALLAGPLLLAFGAAVLRGALHSSEEKKVYRYVLMWAVPGALVFCLQPLWSDFKLHWAFVVWWPLALAFGWAFARQDRAARFARAQIIYGFSLGALVLLSCHLPLTGFVNRAFSGRTPDPRWDVTNDLYGWQKLRDFLREHGGEDAFRIPVVGSRYQTAAQAAFGLGQAGTATLLPRDLKARDEWPSLGVSDHEGPEWPILKSPVWYVADNRYTEGPSFRNANCVPAGRVEELRWGLPAKWIDVWRCDPSSTK